MKDTPQTVLLTEFIEGLSRAGTAAWSLVHQHQDSRFIPIRDRIELVKSKAVGLAVKVSTLGDGTRH